MGASKRASVGEMETNCDGIIDDPREGTIDSSTDGFTDGPKRVKAGDRDGVSECNEAPTSRDIPAEGLAVGETIVLDEVGPQVENGDGNTVGLVDKTIDPLGD